MGAAQKSQTTSKTHLSRVIDAAHGGETILLAKAGKPWARA